MAPRTIAAARAVLDQAAGISDNDRRAYAAEVTAAEHQATAAAESLMDERVQGIAALRDDALRDLCSVRDDFAALVAEANSSPISSAEYARRFNELQARQRQAARAITRTEEALAFVGPVEDDPIAYGDALYAKFPLTQPNFSF